MAEVKLKEIAAITVACLRKQGPVSWISQAFGELYGLLRQAHAPLAAAPPIGVYYAGENFDPANCTYEACAPLAKPITPAKPLEVKDLPAIRAACAVHKGPYEAVGAIYTEIFEWIAANEWQSSGPVREVYLVGPTPDGKRSPTDFVTEIQVPVVKE